MKNKILSAFAGVIILCSWTAHNNVELKITDWLVGTWENKTARGSMYETWTKTSELELSGKSFMLKEKDTLVMETIRLVQEENSIFYIPTVKGQNNDLPVRFTAKIASDKELVFENLQHDFPQKISYTKINADSIVAQISGLRNGQERKITFPMKRIN